VLEGIDVLCLSVFCDKNLNLEIFEDFDEI
jgi:hypothetical protein